MKLLIIFIILSIANVILQTVKSICTVKCGKGVASIVNAIAFGLYTVVIVYTNADFPLWEKVVITAFVNLVGVYIVKYFEEKVAKDKLWLVKITVPTYNAEKVDKALVGIDIPFSEIGTNSSYTVFDCYCMTQKDTTLVLDICKKNNGKAFATENKL